MTRDYDISLEDVCAMEPGPEKAIQYLVYSLLEQGDWHKQWYTEHALIALGVDLALLRVKLEELEREWEPGIAP
jgi:hypothetical protein